MAHTKRVWIVSTQTHYVVERNGLCFTYNLRPTERNGYTSVHDARVQLYRARRELRDESLTVMTL